MAIPKKVVLEMTADQWLVRVVFDDGQEVVRSHEANPQESGLVFYDRTRPGSIHDDLEPFVSDAGGEGEMEAFADGIDEMDGAFVAGILHDFAKPAA